MNTDIYGTIALRHNKHNFCSLSFYFSLVVSPVLAQATLTSSSTAETANMPGVVDTFVGKWTEDSVENFDEFMKALGKCEKNLISQRNSSLDCCNFLVGRARLV